MRSASLTSTLPRPSRKITIINVFRTGLTYHVDFECECGCGTAVWGGDAAPDVGERYHVELEIEAPLVMDVDVVPTNESTGVRVQDGATILCGDVTTVDNDGYARMHLGCGAIDLEVVGPAPVLNGRYRIIAPSLKVFDCGY
jgi:hypothetical protein